MGLVMRRLASVGLVSVFCFVLCGCQERLSAVEKRLPAAEGQALKQAREHWAGEGIKCAVADNCSFKITDDGGRWHVLLYAGDGVDRTGYSMTIDKNTGEADDIYYIMQ